MVGNKFYKFVDLRGKMPGANKESELLRSRGRLQVQRIYHDIRPEDLMPDFETRLSALRSTLSACSEGFAIPEVERWTILMFLWPSRRCSAIGSWAYL